MALRDRLQELKESGFGDLCDELAEAEAQARRVQQANEIAQRRYEAAIRAAERVTPESVDWVSVDQRRPVLPSPFPIALRFDHDECTGRYEIIQPGQPLWPAEDATHWLMLPRAARPDPT